MNRVTLLYLAPALIWGSTWIAIKFQLGVTTPELSVLIRFILATGLLGLWCFYRKIKLMGFTRAQHLWFAAQGAANYSLNYILTYHSEKTLTSGVVAVTFSLMIYFNMLGLRIFFGKRLTARTFFGAVLGGVGICLLYSKEFLLPMSTQTAWAIGLAVLGTLSASTGNLLSVRFRQEQIPVSVFNFWGMFYGALCTLTILLLRAEPLVLDPSPAYWFFMVYLAFVGTVVAFGCYMTLIQLVGADRAAYTTIITPVIALLISTFFESYTWSTLNLLGVAFALLGNILVL